jgi:hypothetical protein
MKVKLRNLLAGPEGVHRAGEVMDVPDVFGAQLIEGGYAERVGQPAEAAVGPPGVYLVAAVEEPEKAAMGKPKKRTPGRAKV